MLIFQISVLIWLAALTIWSFHRQRAYEHFRRFKHESISSNVVRGGDSVLCPSCRLMVANYTRDFDGNVLCANCESAERAKSRKSWITEKKRA